MQFFGDNCKAALERDDPKLARNINVSAHMILRVYGKDILQWLADDDWLAPGSKEEFRQLVEEYSK